MSGFQAPGTAGWDAWWAFLGAGWIWSLAGLALGAGVVWFASARRASRVEDLSMRHQMEWQTALSAALSSVQAEVQRSVRDESQRLSQERRQEVHEWQQVLQSHTAEVARLQGQVAAGDQRLRDLRLSLEERFLALQQGSEARLDGMRQLVEERLQTTLDQRLGESFRQVALRLDQVHEGLGDMRSLARDVGSLQRVLSNVKARGVLGEVQLAGLLEQLLTPEQFARNVEVIPGSGARVEFAVRLPGRGAPAAPAGAAQAHGATGSAAALWLPIDAKFPREDYERLLDAQDQADAAAAELAAKALELRLRHEARAIRSKYVAAPHTTDFGILFLATEGLYAEALRRPGLAQALQSEHQVVLAGPTTLAALLNSLQMGFRTLAIEQRSTEVWQVLGSVKAEFLKFGEVLAKTRKKLEEATQGIDSAEVRTRMLERRLRAVEVQPESAPTPTSTSTSAHAADPGPPGAEQSHRTEDRS